MIYLILSTEKTYVMTEHHVLFDKSELQETHDEELFEGLKRNFSKILMVFICRQTIISPTNHLSVRLVVLSKQTVERQLFFSFDHPESICATRPLKKVSTAAKKLTTHTHL